MKSKPSLKKSSLKAPVRDLVKYLSGIFRNTQIKRQTLEHRRLQHRKLAA